ncbi:MAG: methyltransferase domain-containing protein [Coriobacteriia bacterium]|nr:methyltransferase domain-containing protein [Coriobacteriia bacterium]
MTNDNYIATNKQAWEEAFDLRKSGYGDDVAQRLLSEKPLSFFEDDLQVLLKKIDIKDKTIAHFCCNNGRELLSLMQAGAAHGVGFDIAENILEQARSIAKEAGIKNCEFVAGNILDIPNIKQDSHHDTYHSTFDSHFDLILFTIGALPWIHDLDALFQVVARCLKPGGVLLIHEGHPITNMLAAPGEPSFNPDVLDKAVYPYFNREPWIELAGLQYMTGGNKSLSQPLTSYVHNMGDIITAIANNKLHIQSLQEFDYDIGMLTEVYDKGLFPLSYILLATKD